jgi:hypothetical protein
MSDLRAAADKCPEFKATVLDSIAPVKVLLTQLFERLQLKEESFKPIAAASEEDIDAIWNLIQEIEPSLVRGESLRKEHLLHKEGLRKFIDHCCIRRHYFFVVKKCGLTTCDICGPPRLPERVFSSLYTLPDPMPGEEGHYKQFTELYGTETNESHRPSLQKKSNKRKTLPFACSLRHVKNVDMMLECEHCGLWRLLYSQKKLSRKEREELEEALADFTFTCGAPLQELQLAGKLAEVYVKDITCEDPIERLYYTAKCPPICVYCAAEHYPQCSGCSHKPNILK